jgi:ribosomal subunit interface protein
MKEMSHLVPGTPDRPANRPGVARALPGTTGRGQEFINHLKGLAWAPAGIRLPQEDRMRFQISGKQIDIGEALQGHVKAELGEVTGKYAGRPTDAVVTFSREAHMFACEATVHLSTGLTAQSKGQAPEIYAAFDAAAEKMAKQLRRYKRRLKDHHHARPEPVEVLAAASYIVAPTDEDEESATDHQNPTIIAEMATGVPSLSVGEAVMQMELAHAAVLVFRNEKSRQINVVYRRDDGNIGWIDPQNAG